MTILLVVVLGACGGSGDSTGSSHAAAQSGDSTWQRIADGPLAPRQGAAVGWTGTEVVIVGGDLQDPCPPGADCVYAPEPTADAAAYNPASDTWRKLPDAPARFTDGVAAWIGDELVVVGDGNSFALDPASGSWRRLGPSPDVGDFLVRTDETLVFVSYDQSDKHKSVDWMLDPETGAWSALPPDPFGESYDRSMAWDGERLWLLSMAVEDHFAAVEGAASRLAVLEDDQWRVVDRATPPLTYEQDMWWHGGQLVVPAGPDHRGHTQVFDADVEEWMTLPAAPGTGSCPAPAAGTGPVWLSGGGGELVSADRRETIALPKCAALEAEVTGGPELALWAGESLFVWGFGLQGRTATGLIWTPPASG